MRISGSVSCSIILLQLKKTSIHCRLKFIMYNNTTTVQTATTTSFNQPNLPETLFEFNCSKPFNFGVRKERYNLTPTFVSFSQVIGYLNCLGSFPTVLANIAVIVTILRKQELRTRTNLIITSILIKNLIEGSLAQPSYAVVVLMVAKRQETCINKWVCFLGCMCVVATMLTLLLLQYERFLALFNPYNSESRLSFKRIVIYLTFSWIASAITSFCTCFVKFLTAIGGFASTVAIISSYVFTVYVQVRLYKLARRMRQTDVQLTREIENERQKLERRKKECRATRFVSSIIFIPLVFYFPTAIRNILLPVTGDNKIIAYTVNTLMLLQAGLSPILYAWQSPPIARAVMDTWRSRKREPPSSYPVHNITIRRENFVKGCEVAAFADKRAHLSAKINEGYSGTEQPFPIAFPGEKKE